MQNGLQDKTNGKRKHPVASGNAKRLKVDDEAMKSKLRAWKWWENKRPKEKEYCDWLEAHRKRFIYQNHKAVMCSVVEVDGETFPVTLQLELIKPIHFPPPCSGSQLDRFINNQACWGALYDPSVWILAQRATEITKSQRTTIVEVRPDFYEMKRFGPGCVDYIYGTIFCAQKHMLHYAKAAKWDSEFVCKYKNEYPKGTPLVCACEKGRVEDVEAMIEAARAAEMDVTAMVNEEGTDSNGYSRTPLMTAAANEHSTIVKILLDNNADTATTEYDGYNALHFAVNNRKTTTTVGLLLNNMKLEDINHKTTEYGNTPLDICYRNYGFKSSIVKRLIGLIRQKGGKRESEL